MKGSIQFRLNRSNRKRAKRAELFFKALFHNASQIGRVHIAMAARRDLHRALFNGQEPEIVIPTRTFKDLADQLMRQTVETIRSNGAAMSISFEEMRAVVEILSKGPADGLH